MTRLEFFETVGYKLTEQERETLFKLDTGILDNLYYRVARGQKKTNWFLHYLIMYDMFYNKRSVEIVRES